MDEANHEELLISDRGADMRICRAGAKQQQNGDEPDKPRRKLIKGLKLITISTRFRPKSTRSKTVDAVSYAVPKLVGKPTEPIPIHNCRSAEADCVPGPSTPPSRMRSNARGSHDETRPDNHFTNSGESASTGPPPRNGSSATGPRSSDSGTAVTTPEKDNFIPRPGVIPPTSSFEESPLRYGPPDVRFVDRYWPRSSDGTAAGLVHVKGQEVKPELSWVDLQNYDMLSQAPSQPQPPSSYKPSTWRPKPDKGKAKQREYMEDVDGKLTKKEKRKSFDPPPRPKSPPMVDPSHDDWREKPQKEKLKISAMVHHGLSTWSFMSAVKRKQPPVVDPIGPDDEAVVDVEQEEATLRERKGMFRRKSGEPSRVVGNSNSSPMETVDAALPVATAQALDIRDDIDTSSLSSASSESGFSICDFTDDEFENIPRDSTRPSGTTKHFRNSSIDLEALNSAQVKAACYEKKCRSKKNNNSFDDEDDSQEVSRCGSISLDGLQKLEMYRSKPNAEAHFEICGSPRSITKDENRLSNIEELGALVV